MTLQARHRGFGARLRSAVVLVCLAATAMAGPPPPQAAAPQARPGQVAAELGDAQRALAEGRIQEAIAGLERLRLRWPDAAEVRLWLGHAYRLGGDRVAAVREYLAAARLEQGNAEIQVALGEVYEEAGNAEAAAAAYRRAIELQPELADGHRKLAAIQMRLQRYGEAAGNLERYLALRPDDAVAHYLLGYARFMHQEYDAAVRAFERALDLNPDGLEAHHGLGVVLARRPEEYDRALVHLRAALPLNGGNATAHYLMGKIHLDRGDLEAAREALERSIELNPGQAEAHYQLARVYARLGDRQAAAAAQRRFSELQGAEKSNEVEGKRLKTLKNAVSAALADDDLARAGPLLEELLEAAPQDVDTWTLAAKVWFSADRGPAALEATDRALGIDPDHWEALYVRGIILLRAGRLREARSALEASLQSHPLFADSYAVLGNVLLALGSPAAAADAYRRALALDPGNPGYYLNLAAAYRRLGASEKEAEAMEAYRKALGIRTRRGR